MRKMIFEYTKNKTYSESFMLEFLANSVITPLLPFFLGVVAILLYRDVGFFPFSKLRQSLSSLFSSTDSSSWRALSVALAGTLGVGNIENTESRLLVAVKRTVDSDVCTD